MAKKPPVVVLPDEVWQNCEYTSIHCAVLVAGFKDVAGVVSEMPPAQLDALIDSFQTAVLALAEELKQAGYPVGEIQLHGTSLRICFYDQTEVGWNYQLDGPDPVVGSDKQAVVHQCQEIKEHLALKALQAAINLKNRWLTQEFNISRVKAHLEHWKLSIGIHSGRVYLKQRADGAVRVEGGMLELASKVLSSVKKPLYSNILVSQRAKDYIVRMVQQHSQLRKRIFFLEYPLAEAELKGFSGANSVWELKFFHRIGVHLTDAEVAPFEALFALNRGDRWSYNMLADYYGYSNKRWMKMFALAKLALMVHPGDETILLDMANVYLEINKPHLAQKGAEESLVTNPSFDLAFEMLARIAQQLDDIKGQIKHWRNAMYLSPDSALNSFNLGLALLEDNQKDEGYFFIEDALRTYPDYVKHQLFRETLLELKKKGNLPSTLELFLEYFEDEAEDEADATG